MTQRRARLVGLLVSVVAFVGCQRAGRYPSPVVVKPSRVEKVEPPPAHWSWHLPVGWQAPLDVPVVFISKGHKDWDGLSGFWTHFPPPAAGVRTVHLGQSPLGMAAAVVLADRLEVFKVKVPLGLPDPTFNIPPANSPTFGKWKLGRKIFFDRKLKSGEDTFACATCHKPDQGFTEDRAKTLGGLRNTPSLINVVFSRQQFWDGRATALEEVLVRTLEDERPLDDKWLTRFPQETHRWGGLIRALGADIDYRLDFQTVFDIKQPTQDAVAKALATYLRTILSGNSLYDRAEQERRRKNAPMLLAEHFAALLDDSALEALRVNKDDKPEMARKLEHGHRLFREKGCVTCHAGPLFTDHGFHNIGIGESDRFREPGLETGRFAHVPIGLKEPRLIGAFRTPTLRALPRTAPYFHDGTYPDLLTVVKYYNHSVHGYRHYLAAPLLDGEGHAKKLDMTFEDEAALAVFLRSLDGEPVDRIVAAPAK